MSAYRVTIVSRSMEPALPLGAEVDVTRQKPEVGDVAAFMAGEQVMVHRVLAQWETRIGTFYVHCGDASPRWGVFREHELLGAITSAERKAPPALTAHWLWFLGRVAQTWAEYRRRRA